jgi:DNA-binding Lrp family transcriptional regulator
MHLSATQRKLLKLLAMNSRFTNKDLARAIGVSADTVQYQLEKLLQEKVISLAFHVDCRALGYEYFQCFIRTKGQKIDVARLRALPFITFIGRTIGRYDIEITILARSKKEYEERLRKALRIIGAVQEHMNGRFDGDFKWTNIIEPFHVAVRLPSNRKNPLYSLAKENVMGPRPARITLDGTDKRILFALTEKPRAHTWRSAGSLASRMRPCGCGCGNWCAKGCRYRSASSRTSISSATSRTAYS